MSPAERFWKMACICGARPAPLSALCPQLQFCSELVRRTLGDTSTFSKTTLPRSMAPAGAHPEASGSR